MGLQNVNQNLNTQVQDQVTLSQDRISYVDKSCVAERAPEKEAARTEVQKTPIERLISSTGNTAKLGIEVLQSFIPKLASIGLTLNSSSILNIDGKLKDEYQKLFGDKESSGDEVFLSQRASADNPTVQGIKRLKTQTEGEGSSQSGASADDAAELAHEFSAVAAEYLSSSNFDERLSGRLRDLREKLRSKGLSPEELASLEKGLKSDLKQSIAERAKDGQLVRILTYDHKTERAISERGLSTFVEGLTSNEKLGGTFIKDEIQETVLQALADAREELKGFVVEELENILIKKTLFQDKNLDEALKLISLGSKVGFNQKEWIAKVWMPRREDLGLNFIDVPPEATGLIVDTETDNPQSKHRRQPQKEKNEKEILMDRLRALYLLRSLKGDAATHLDTAFKIRKLKNGMFQLGIMTRALDDQIKHEAEVLAKMKTVEMLKEAFLERGTLYELAGPAHQLIERKIKGLLKNAERLGLHISEDELNTLRDNANRRMFELSKKELELVQVAQQAGNTPELDKKEKLLIKLLKRLKEESGIEEEITENLQVVSNFSLVEESV